MSSIQLQSDEASASDFAMSDLHNGLGNPRENQAKHVATKALTVGLILMMTLSIQIIGSFFLQKRAQQQLLAEFASTLSLAASAYGQEGVSPLPDTAPTIGSAVALLEIPQLGLSQVVVEGNSSKATQSGPAHLPGTVLPGQAGEAIIIGHRTTFGAPFFRIDQLKAGALLKVTTLEGPSTYRVIDEKTAVAAPPENRLVLRTSTPAVLGTGTLQVIAELQGKPYVGTPRNSPIIPSSSQWPLMLLLLVVVYALVRIFPIVRNSFSPLVTWLLLAPITASCLLGLALALDALLPATL